MLLLQNPDEGEAQGADLGFQPGIRGGLAQGAAEWLPHDGIVVAGQKAEAVRRQGRQVEIVWWCELGQGD